MINKNVDSKFFKDGIFSLSLTVPKETIMITYDHAKREFNCVGTFQVT